MALSNCFSDSCVCACVCVCAFAEVKENFKLLMECKYCAAIEIEIELTREQNKFMQVTAELQQKKTVLNLIIYFI